jgi:hypothetical protein
MPEQRPITAQAARAGRSSTSTNDVSVIAAQCEEVLLRAGFRFAHCGGSFVIFGPGENCRPASCELIAELLTQHARFGIVACGWEERDVPLSR